MARRNISIPDDLEDRLKAEDSVNWSAVAVKAFEIELGEIAKRNKVENMDDVIARLRASKIQHEDTESEEGRTDGYQWAKKTAEIDELMRLAKKEEARLKWEDWDPLDIVNVATDENQSIDYIWGDDIPNHSPKYFNAFVAGAVELFEKVKDKI